MVLIWLHFCLFNCLFTFSLVDESPRWLISNGFDEKAMILLAKIAKLNGRKLPNNMNLADNRKHVRQRTHINNRNGNWFCRL